MPTRLRFALALVVLTLGVCRTPTAAPVVVVAGASGETGVLVVRALKDKGLTVRGLVRDIASAQARHGNLAEWWLGDARNPPQALQTAFAGADYAVSVIGSRERDGPNSFENVDWAGNRNLIDAARTAGVKRFVLMSSGSAGPDDIAGGRFGAGRVWKFKAEEYLRASGVAYTIVAPGGLRNTPGGVNGLTLLPRNLYKAGIVTRADVASVIAYCVDTPTCAGKTITVINAADAPPGTWPGALAALPADSAASVRIDPAAAPKQPLP